MSTGLHAVLLLGLLADPAKTGAAATSPVAPPIPDVATVEAEVDRLAAQQKYLSAVTAITSSPERLASPRLLRKATHLLVSYYVISVNFGLFALRDLAPGERIEQVRGKAGDYVIVGGDWEKVLFEALAARPEDPELSFAVGEYLSRGAASGCGRPQFFTGDRGDDYPYFERAYRAGLRDAWSLFRMGLHHLSAEPPDLRRAVALFDEALALSPDDVATHYDKAAALMLLGEPAAALVHSRKALGRYGNASLDADTYNLQARIEVALGEVAAAERDFGRALELLPQHDKAFSGLLQLLRSGKKETEYRSRVLKFASLDFANTWPLGVWVEYVGDAGVEAVDREIEKTLATRRYAGLREVGAVFYNLGRFLEIAGDRAGAHRNYRRSLEALRRQKDPPAGSVEVLEKLVEGTRGASPSEKRQ